MGTVNITFIHLKTSFFRLIVISFGICYFTPLDADWKKNLRTAFFFHYYENDPRNTRKTQKKL